MVILKLLFSFFCVCFVVSSQDSLTFPISVTHSASGNDLEWIDLGGGKYHTSLEFDACEFDISPGNIGSFVTRCYNDSIPGPTLRMIAGNTYSVKVINSLGPENSNNHNIPENEFRNPNHTNLHTHGLHVSGSSPGDYVFLEIGPGESSTFTYMLPCNHAGGTFWYHPHVHGSTALQVGGGGIGMIIVEDDQDREGLPDWLVNMNEVLLGVYYMDLMDIVGYSTSDDLYEYTTEGNEKTAFHLVNGQYQPIIEVNSNEWKRFRISYANVESPMTLYLDDCDLYLISKDGVLIHGSDNTVPRQVDAMWFTTGSRADVAVYCPGSSSGSVTYELTDENKDTIAYIKVTGTNTSPTSPVTTLTSFNPIRPSYLVDLQNLDYSNNFHQFSDGSYCVSIEIDPTTIYGSRFSHKDNYFWNIPIGSYVEFQLDAGRRRRAHPFHMHINHVQILSGGTANLAMPNNWLEYGDYLDVVHGDAVVRWYADTYGGTTNMHCHILPHEDRGAMGVFWIDGGCNAENSDFDDTPGTCNVPTCDESSSKNSEITGKSVSNNYPSSDKGSNGSFIASNIAIVLSIVISVSFVIISVTVFLVYRKCKSSKISNENNSIEMSNSVYSQFSNF